jgi:hypothetical protein
MRFRDTEEDPTPLPARFPEEQARKDRHPENDLDVLRQKGRPCRQRSEKRTFATG